MATNPAAVNVEAVKSEVRGAIINQKANACPMVCRLAWHASGTYHDVEGSGGSNGATMRFAPESGDPANAGLSIVRDMLEPVKQAHPELSNADLWIIASCAAIEFVGGPRIPYRLGRSDARDGSSCPPVGRLPDATQGAQHLRDVFYRMGFQDRDIVALSGAHTLGRCHQGRSGFDGPWTSNPLKFDNEYFKNLIELEWTPRKWDGPLQYTDPSGQLMMLPTDLALVQDASFRPFVELYARDEAQFFHDFKNAFGRLLANGCPAHCNPSTASSDASNPSTVASNKFLENCMHGSLEMAQSWLQKGGSVHAVESNSGRTGMHKAAFWGHAPIVSFLVSSGVNVDATDYQGDTALNDAVRFGHAEVVKILLEAGSNPKIINQLGQDALGVARAYKKDDMIQLLQSWKPSKL